MKKIKTLFFAASPVGCKDLMVEEEIREVTYKIRTTDYRHSIDLVPALAARPGDLIQILNEHKPQIVHFTAHGKPTGEILLLDKIGGFPKPVGTLAVQELFTVMKDNIRVVLLNACYSRTQALAIANVIDCVIGIRSSITNQAAITFSAFFYGAIGFGRSVKEAYEQGRAAVLLEGINKKYIPDLLVKDGADPSKIFLIPESDGTESKGLKKKTKELLDAGLELFNMRDYRSAISNFQKARKLDPGNETANIFYCLAFLAGKQNCTFHISEMNEINDILNNVIQGNGHELINLARLLLGIIRFDYYEHRNYHYQGISSEEIFSQLEDYYPSDREKQIIQHITFSDMVKILFNLS